jgi:hypothetical protein
MNQCRIQRLRKHSATGISSVNKRVLNSPTQKVSFSPEVEFVFATEATTDADSDGYTNATELSAGTNPNDSNDFPVTLFNVFNNI